MFKNTSIKIGRIYCIFSESDRKDKLNKRNKTPIQIKARKEEKQEKILRC